MTDKIYDINPHRDHVLVNDEGKWLLLDTGAGTTVGPTSEFTFKGEKFPCVNNYFGVSTPGLSELVGHRVDYLVGLEVLRKFPFKIDMGAGKVTFYDEGHKFDEGFVVPLRSPAGLCGALTFQFKFNGEIVEAIFDTGAPINYMNKPVGEPDGSAEDFFPAFGRWTTKLYWNEVEFGDRKLRMKFGVIPSSCYLSRVAPWLVGGGFLKSGPIGFDINNRKLHLFSNN